MSAPRPVVAQKPSLLPILKECRIQIWLHPDQYTPADRDRIQRQIDRETNRSITNACTNTSR